LSLFHLQLPMLRSDIVDDIFDLIIIESLVGLEWRELIKIVIKLSPSCMKFTDGPVVQVEKDIVPHETSLSLKCMMRERMFSNALETFSVTRHCF